MIYREKIFFYKPLRVVWFQYDLQQTVSDLWDLRSNYQLGSQAAPSVRLFGEKHDDLLCVSSSFRLSTVFLLWPAVEGQRLVSRTDPEKIQGKSVQMLAQLLVTLSCLSAFLFSRLPTPSSHLWTLQDFLTRVPERCLPVCLPQAVPQNSSILMHLFWSSAFHFHYPRATGCPPRCLDALTGVPEAMAADSSIPSYWWMKIAAHQELERTSWEAPSEYAYMSCRKDLSVLCCQRHFFSPSQWSKYFRSAVWLCGKGCKRSPHASSAHTNAEVVSGKGFCIQWLPLI